MRRVRLPLAAAFVIVALFWLVSVTAFRQGAVSDSSTLTVVSTDTAAFALAPGTGNAANQAAVSSGILQIDFRKASGGVVNFSAQRDRAVSVQRPNGAFSNINVSGDILRMRQVFTVTNNSTDCHDVSVYVTSGGPTLLAGIYGRRSTDLPAGTQLSGAGGAKLPGVSVKLGTSAPANTTLLVDFLWQAGATGFATTGNFTVEVSGALSATCP